MRTYGRGWFQYRVLALTGTTVGEFRDYAYELSLHLPGYTTDCVATELFTYFINEFRPSMGYQPTTDGWLNREADDAHLRELTRFARAYFEFVADGKPTRVQPEHRSAIGDIIYVAMGYDKDTLYRVDWVEAEERYPAFFAQ
jgi:hypothetical protein